MPCNHETMTKKRHFLQEPKEQWMNIAATIFLYYYTTDPGIQFTALGSGCLT